MAEKKNPTIKKAREGVTYLTRDEAVRRIEFLHEKWEMDRIVDINYAKKSSPFWRYDTGKNLRIFLVLC